MMMRRIFAMVAFVALLGACGDEEGAEITTTSPHATTTTVLPTTSAARQETTITHEERPDVKRQDPEAILIPVMTDAAERSEVEMSEVKVVEIEFVEWPDSALGCPEPGQMYTQVITPGFRIEVSAGDQTFDYRAARSGFWKLCEQ